MDKNQRIKDVFSDEEFVKRLIAMQSYEEAQKILEEKDIDISVEDLKKARTLLIKKAKGDLTDDELEQVAGGSVFGSLYLCLLIALSFEMIADCLIVQSAKDC